MPIRSTNFDAASLASLRHAKRVQTSAAHAQTQMKMGRRITSVKDDASGAAIAATLKARNAGASEGVRNLQEVSAALSIAESAMNILADKLNNLKALGIRAATGLKTTANLVLIQREISEINGSIGSSVQEAEYNGRKLLTGGIHDAGVNYGIGSLTFTILTSTLSGLGLTGGDGADHHFRNISSGAGDNPVAQILSYISGVNAAINKLSAIRGNLGATQVLVDSAIESVQSNIDRTEEARSTIEDMDSLEAQVNATTAQSQMNLALQAFLLSMQDNFRNAGTGMQTMQLLMQS